MAHPDGGSGSHVIDIDANADDGTKHTEPPLADELASHAIVIDVVRTEPSECAVCMEPLEWVAIGPCGHREVCSQCAVHIRVRSRSKPTDRRCSICREPCPAVVVTKAGGGRHLYTKLASLGSFQGRVGDYWYHGASAAYFDDERQYEATRMAYLDLEDGDARAKDADDGQVAPCVCICSPVARAMLYVAIFLFVCVIVGVSTGVINIRHWGSSY
ncbi:unnamed protein product [Alopecurus aequalis]